MIKLISNIEYIFIFFKKMAHAYFERRILAGKFATFNKCY